MTNKGRLSVYDVHCVHFSSLLEFFYFSHFKLRFPLPVINLDPGAEEERSRRRAHFCNELFSLR